MSLSASSSTRAGGHISGLDSLRFLCALIVVMGHMAVPLPDLGSMGRPVQVLWANLFNGPAAVIVFFLLSGFVIHLPQVRRGTTFVSPPEFYARRFIRIIIPSVLAVALFVITGSKLPGVLWSIICEGIYYALYPALLIMSRRVGWTELVAVSWTFAFLLAVTNPDLLAAQRNGYLAFGYQTWIIGLPVWLMGCWLAENYSRFPTISAAKMNAMRLGIFGLTVVLRVVKFQAPAPWGSSVIWLNVFAFAAVAWLGFEIAFRSKNPAPGWLERLGVWSFSLYLVHMAVVSLAEAYGVPQTFTYGILTLAAVLVSSFLFYLVIERPSHHLARWIGGRLGKRTASPVKAVGLGSL